MKKYLSVTLVAAAITVATAGCDSVGGANTANPSGMLGTDNPGNPALIPGGGNPSGGNPNGAATPVVGTSCRSNDPNHICIALNYVAFKNPNGNATVTQATAITNVQGINQLWSQCNIGFQIEEYQEVDPTQKGVATNTANNSDLDVIRAAYNDNKSFLVVTTGTWDRSGSLGATAANAWTSMPGSTPYGAVLEQPVGNFSNIIAHELGHYLNLDHVSDTSDLMNPVIYSSSNSLYPSQCNTARSAANYFWTSMLR